MGVVFAIVGWVIHMYVFVIMVRFLGHAFGLPYSNQFMQLLYNLTRIWSVPLRAVFPLLYGIDTGLLFGAFALLLLKASLPLLIGLSFSTQFITLAFVEMFMMVVDIFFFSIIISIIVSFLVPGLYHPVIQAVHYLTEPLLKPVRQAIPPISGFDLSPIIVIMALKASEMILMNVLR